MFEAPRLISNIPDIVTIYEINDGQIDELDASLEELEGNLLTSTMNAENVGRWEAILGINPSDSDTLDERRFRILSRKLEKLPYSYRVIYRKLETLSPDGVEMNIDYSRKHLQIKIGLQSAQMLAEVEKFLEEALPLSMTYMVDIMWNTHKMLSTKTHGELASLTYGEMRQKIMGV